MKRTESSMLWSFLVSGLLVLTGACGGGDSTSSGSSGGTGGTTSSITTMDQLPEATSPVTESSSSVSALRVSPKALATSGMGLETAPTFTGESSLAACEMYNQTKQAIAQAAEGDLIQCFIASVMEARDDHPEAVQDSNGVAIPEGTLDIYDGSPHVFTVEVDRDADSPDHIKFSLAKDSDGTITAFTMYACRGGDQMMYLNQTITDGTDFAMTAKGTYQDGTYSGSYHTTVTGTLEGGSFVGEKPIRMRFTNTFEDSGGSGDMWGDITFTQMAESGEINGYMDGTNTFDGQTFDWVNQIAGSLQLIDGNTDLDNYNLGLLALGDGAIKGAMVGSGQGGSWNETFSEAWSGDTGLQVSTSTFLDAIADLSLPTASEPTIAFEGAEAYDCGDTEEALVSFTDAGIDPGATCSNLVLDQMWVDCWNTVGEEQN